MKLAILIGVLLGFLSVLLSAQEEELALPVDIDSPEVTVDFRLGFGGYAFSDEPNPAVVLLKNEADRVLTGEVVVEAAYFQRGKLSRRHRESSVPVELGQGARQSVSFLLSGVRTGSFIVSYREGSRVLWQRYVYIESVEERSHRLYLWSVTPETRVLEAGPPLRRTAVTPQGQRVMPQRNVRPLVEAKVPAWALPSNPRHLALGNGVMLGREALTRLTGAQEEALAKYVVHGGVLLVPRDSEAFEKQLWARTPFEVSSLEDREARVGLGRVLRYAPNALTQGGGAENAWLYEAIDETPRRAELSVVPQRHRRSEMPAPLGERARDSKRACLWFIGLFMLATGPGVWFLRKLPRRRFLWFLGGIVTVFCVVAIVFGVRLQGKPGELWWSSFTELSQQGGALQTSVFQMESAGARSHRLAVSDPEAMFYHPRLDYHSFSDEAMSGEVEVPILPWSHRTVVSETELPKCQPIRCSLKMVSPTRMELSWENPNDFKIVSVALRFWSRVGRPVDAFEPRLPKLRRGQLMTLAGGLRGNGVAIPGENRLPLVLHDYHQVQSSLLEDGSSELSPRIGVNLYRSSVRDYTQIASPYSAVILFEVDRSPGVTIEEEKTNFFPTKGMHYVAQTLATEDLPPFEALFTKEPYVVKPAPEGRRRSSRRR